MASGDKNYDIAKQSTLTTSIGSSESEIVNTSLFGKINNLINTLATHVTNWTSARAEKIDTIATDSASAKTDAASNKSTLSTLSTTVETINTNASNLNTRLTSIRADYLDYLDDSTYGLNAIKTAIDKIGGIATGGTTNTVYTETFTIPFGESSNSYTYHLAKFIAPASGIYKIVVTFSRDVSALNNFFIYYPDVSTESFTPSNYNEITLGIRLDGLLNYNNSQYIFGSDETQTGSTRTIYGYATAGQLCVISSASKAALARPTNITGITVTY